jgi:muconolactone D-isomerase
MPHFLAHIAVQLPPDLAPTRREQLLDAEAARARELRSSGELTHIWRLPGRHANISIYETPDATRLHELLSSLPLFPWMTIEVQALAVHPLDTGQPA